ncbi:MAG: PRC-barrel domain-containing protein [Chloroflexi bacterium]|nr:PRC-barrel domain-containing protein [Chloroflexota bacterium]
MEISIGSRVTSSLGREIGKVTRVVFDPTTNDVDQVVIKAGDRERVVPINMVESADAKDTQLRIGVEVVDSLPEFVSTQYEEAPPTCPAVTAYRPGKALPPSTLLFPTGPTTPISPPPTREVSPARGFTIVEGTEVEALDGKIGVVDQVLTDQYQDKITGFTVRRGTLLRRDVRVPIEWVSQAGPGCINLSVTRAQLEEHPLPPEGPYIPTESIQ